MLSELNKLIAKNLFNEPSLDDLFNPYSTMNPDVDRADAVEIRRTNLNRYILDRRRNPLVLLLAEAPGPWGCRFSGVPITSEEQLLEPSFPLDGRQASLAEKPYKEYSASVYWRVLQPFYEHIFTWNTVPFHPHHIGKPLSIRTPRASEINRFTSLLEGIVSAMNPKLIIAVGRKAEKALSLIGAEAVYVRHPSQGGATLFEQGVLRELRELNLPATDE